uniref:Lipocalin-like domain-containing protein n=1 Tax=Prevotella sp. GTC17254 TaxID=3236794 RepID=A0AB33J3F6_9BACT
MKKLFYLSVAMLLLATSFVFSSCSKNDDELPGNTKELLIGTWQTTWEESELQAEGEKEPTKESHEYTRGIYTFNADNFGTFQRKKNTEEVKMKWTLNGNKLTCTAKDDAEEFTVIEISNAKLVLEMQFTGKLKGWERLTLKRIRR